MTDFPRVAACQFEPTPLDVTANTDAIAETVAGLDADTTLAVFPELCVTGYVPNSLRDLAAPIPGALTDPLVAVADEHDVTLAVGVPERRAEDVYNSLAVVDGEGVRAVYRKQYLWGDEGDVFTAGDGPTVLDTDVGRVGFLVCYDLNFPETALAYAQRECDVLAVSSAWRESYRDDWRLLLRSRAFDGTCYLVAANHAGSQRGRVHAGESSVVAPDGTVLDALDGETSVATAAVEERVLERARERNPVRQTRRRKADDVGTSADRSPSEDPSVTTRESQETE